ncbi:MAG: response regulator [Calditrichaeota bacterium]|nr:MAG: response regulator [Calditrichota bacterium]MBL1204870.1 response regulator [Calditrichota bacterium]NOG44699.1 response regulator [Calditrichota bacterium]
MPKKALIIDDEEALTEIIVEVLSTLDFESYPAISGEDAIKIANQNDHFDLIIIDMNMPGMNGEETYNNIKTGFSDTPLIFMSGYDLSEEMAAMNLKCPNIFLKKPFTIADLTKTVSQLLP